MKIFVVGALPSSLYNFRGELLKEFSSRGYDVFGLASNASETERRLISNLNVTYIDYCVSRNGLNPISDLRTLLNFFKLFRQYTPSIILCYTIKPVIWGGVAARFSSTKKFYALITGLGYAFQKGGFLKNALNYIVKHLYRYSLKYSSGVIFQNNDNMKVFIDEGIVPSEKCFVVNGSGVNLNHFPISPLPATPRFLLIARLLGDKGIREYVKAAVIVKQKYPDAIFELVGPEDPSPNGIQFSEVERWCAEGVITYRGATSDVRDFIKQCSIYVLPSYHEGLPRTVLEAMAMGRPILTTDVPGCKETVINGENGWLVEKASVEQLAERMIWFIENSDQWFEMGAKSHNMAYEKFDVHKVNSDILKIMGISNEKAV